MRVFLIAECAEPPGDFRATAGFTSLRKRDLEVALRFLAFRRRARAGVARGARASTLELASHPAAKPTQLLLARGYKNQRLFRELVRHEDEIASRVDLEAVFDLSAYTRHVDTVFARLHSIAVKEEPVHV